LPRLHGRSIRAPVKPPHYPPVRPYPQVRAVAVTGGPEPWGGRRGAGRSRGRPRGPQPVPCAQTESGTDETGVEMSEPAERVDLATADTDGDGKPDVWVADTDGDGKPDRFEVDLDKDG